MQPQGLDHVGEEPIYCETQHDDILYSGSEDDYYEAPEHRRLRIEAKAVQFLNGNLPYLLSARLKGPFDGKSWNNPWKSKRAQRKAAQLKIQSQSRRSLTTVEAGRGHSSGRPIDDLPDTQRTSLYPLPSPETTNPPSARKNPFMAEAEFNRIKTWRETVKSVPVSTDPFWTSHQDKSQQSTATRKRSADQDWLRKRESKKRKSEDLRKLAPEESPSQNAAKIRGSLLQDRFAEIVTQSAPGSSTHEDELTAHWGPHMASFDTSRMANIPTNTPGVLPSTRAPPQSTKQLFVQDPDSSEDELSMPSTAPSRNASRSPIKRSLGSSAENTPIRRQKRDGSDASWSRGRFSAAKLHLGSDFLEIQRSVTGRLDDISSQRERTTGNLSAAIDSKTSDASQIDVPMTQRAPQGKSTKAARRSSRQMGASQQDNSFYFHQAASKGPSRKRDLPSRSQMEGTTPKLTTSLQGGAVFATERSKRDVDQLCAKEDQLCAGAPSGHQMHVDPCEGQKIVPTALVTASQFDEQMTAPDAVRYEPRAIQPQFNEALPMGTSRSEKEAEVLGQSMYERSQTYTNAEPDLSKPVCTQELSPVSMQHKAQSPVLPINAAGTQLPTIALAIDSNDSSNLEWSTYINTQDLSTTSEKSPASGEIAKDLEAIPQGTDNMNDSDWTTYINTQDTIDPPIESSRVSGVSKVEDVDLTAEKSPDRAADPERSTFGNTRNQQTVETQYAEVADAQDSRGSDVELSDHKVADTAADDTNSSSETSSHMSASSHGDADQTGDTSNEPVVDEAPTANSQGSHVTLGSIIDAYCGSQEPHDEFEDCPKGLVSDGHQQNPDAAFESKNVRADQDTEGGRQVNTNVSAEGDCLVPAAPMAQSEQHPERIESSAFDLDENMISLDLSIPSVKEGPVQSPWAKGGTDLPMPFFADNDTTTHENTSKLSFLAGQALAFSPAPQTPWIGDRLPSPDFSLSVKKFSDFMIPSPSKKRVSTNGSILRGLSSASRGLFSTPISSKPKRRVTFAPLPGEEEAPAAPESKANNVYLEEDLSYFDANGNKTGSIRITRSQTRAASPPPLSVGTTDADELPDHDDKFARHFEAMSKRKDLPRKTQRLLPSESQQTNSSHPIDAMAEAFIEASQTRKKSPELVEAVDDNTRLFRSSSEKTDSPMTLDAIEQQENIDPVDDVSAVLDNIDDFLYNSWGFDTRINVDMKKKQSTRQQAETVPDRFASVGDPMVTMHANVWAD